MVTTSLLLENSCRPLNRNIHAVALPDMLKAWWSGPCTVTLAHPQVHNTRVCYED